MCSIPRLIAAFSAVIGLGACPGIGLGRIPDAVGPDATSSAGPSTATDPVLPLLAEEDYAQSRRRIQDALRQNGDPCRALGAYASARDSRVREHAVRALADAGCADFRAYAGYGADRDAWVIDAVIRAAERHLMAGAVPLLLRWLSDPRRILGEEGTWTIGDTAHRGLQAITCQSFHYDSVASADDRRNALTRWRQWYLAHRGEPRDAWVKAGIERARDYAARDYGPHRLEGLRLLALIGEPALPALRDLLGRSPGDLRADLACRPEEPPRPTDQVPCALVVRNVTARHVAFAPPPGGPEVRVTRDEDPPESGKGARRPARASAPGAGPPAPGAGPAARAGATLAALAARLDDLAPGEVRRYEFAVGPVAAPGRYRVRATLSDLALDFTSGPAPVRAPAAIETETIVPFNL
ncbi:MAG: hypothetical protein HYS34_08855 [Acidobacteria bacterium]|nr:hypothetical protein [Acidobacteriota bacterium]